MDDGKIDDGRWTKGDGLIEDRR